MTLQQRKYVTVGLIALALLGFFAWGFGFDLFGKRILLDWEHAGLLVWLVIGVFATGFPRGLGTGLRRALLFSLLVAAALLLGYLRGNYS